MQLLDDIATVACYATSLAYKFIATQLENLKQA